MFKSEITDEIYREKLLLLLIDSNCVSMYDINMFFFMKMIGRW